MGGREGKGKGKRNLNLNFSPYTKINSKRITHLYVKCKVLRKKIKILKILPRKEFLGLTQKAWSVKEHLICWMSSNIKQNPSFTLWNPCERCKENLETGRKYFQMTLSSKVLVSQIYFLKLKPQHNKIFLSIHLENGQMTWTDILLKRIDSWHIII